MSSINTTDKLAINIPISIDDVIQCKVDDKTMNNTNDNILHVTHIIQVLMAITLIIMIMLSIY